MTPGEILQQRGPYVAGHWVDGDKTFAVENPADESEVAQVSDTPLPVIEQAITEARKNFDQGAWADRPARDRARVVHEMLDFLETLHEPFVATMVAEAGQPTAFAEMAQYSAGIDLARNTIDLFLSLPEEESNPAPLDELLRRQVTLSLRRYEPLGVVAAITPFNGAVIMAFQKLIPALMAGNSVILRPSPLTPISSLAFGAATDAAELPPGVLSVVTESGSAGAELLSSHPGVDMVSFTGSTNVGRQILAQAAASVKRVVLEMGGKSAQIYLPDSLHRVPVGAAQVVAMTSGQACVAATRMLVPEELKDEALQAASATYGTLKVGPPSDPTALLGPVISAAERDRCEHFVSLAEEHGGKVMCGGKRPDGLDRGYYFEPTVLDLPDNENPAAREEIFGPILGVIGYRDLDDAVCIANDSVYGLSGQVYGSDVAAAAAVARRIRSGAVSVNAGFFSAYAPGGGYKQSGLGRERGIEGIRAFQEVKHLSIGELPS